MDVDVTKSQVYTIGHSNHSITHWVSLLQRYCITAVADVRSTPYSRVAPHFSNEALQDCLRKYGIKYVFLGKQLGARSDDPSCYENGQVIFDRLASTERFQQGINRILRGMKEERIALMCAEKEPLACHRSLLIARILTQKAVGVDHILADGRVESQEGTLLRLLDMLNLPHATLLETTDEIIASALKRQEKRVAYVDPSVSFDRLGGES